MINEERSKFLIVDEPKIWLVINYTFNISNVKQK